MARRASHSAFALLALVLAGCGLGHGGRRELGLAPPAPARVSLGDVMGTGDRARLESVGTGRASEPPAGGYRIGPDDLLEIRVPDLLEAQGSGVSARAGQGIASLPTVAEAPVFQQGVRVSAAGNVSLPTLGLVRAAGLTASELEEDIARRLIAARVLVAPHVSVLIAEYRSRVVAVVGSVERPGLYPLTRPGATIADLIWAAGGPGKEAGRVVEFVPAADGAAPSPLAPRALPSAATDVGPPGSASLAVRAVRVEPVGSGRRVTIALTRVPDGVRDFTLRGPPRVVIDLEGPAADGDTRFVLGDDVVPAVRAAAHDARLRAVLDLSREADAYVVRTEGASVIVDLGDTGVSAPPVSTAWQPGADAVAPGGPIHLDLDAVLHASGREAAVLNPQVRPGDAITLSPAGSVQVDGWVDKPGSYPVTRGLTLAGAVAAAGGHLFPADRRHVTVKRALASAEQRYFTVDLDAVSEGSAPDVPITDGDVVRLPASSARLLPWGAWNVLREMVHVGGNVLLF